MDDEIRGDSHASSSHEASEEPTFKRRGKHSVKTQETEIARSVRGLKSQGPRAEDAMAEPYT